MSARSSLHPGEILSKRYRIEKQLAQGGMGAVFEATHVATEMRVAVKVLWPHVLEQAGAVQRFQLEARVAARVASPHIVKVLDAGFDEDGELPFLVMELLNGEDLKSLVLRKGPLEPSFVIRLLRQAASGLDAAHGYVDASGKPQPIIHRDLKPANLFVSDADGNAPFVRILDFGIAKVLGESMHVSTDLKGTPLYMAPEQIRGKRVFPQTDVWAIGLVAYFLLTGKAFWTGAQGDNPNLLAVLDEIASLRRARPAARIHEQGLSGVVPAAFDEWMLRCLDGDPSRRYATVGETVAALESALRDGFRLSAGSRAALVSAHSSTELDAPVETPLVDRSLTPVQGAPPQPRNNPRALAVGAIAAAALVGLSILATGSGDPVEADDAARSAAAGPPAPADPAPPTELTSSATPEAEPIVVGPTPEPTPPAPTVVREERTRPLAEPHSRPPRPAVTRTAKKGEPSGTLPSPESSANPSARPSAKPPAPINAFDLR
jgi:serine/threonine-protein kinase